MGKIRTRYAPSPTGFLHIGGARTALFSYLLAKHHGGDFILRFEDTDQERNIAGGEESQYELLNWMGVVPDESPFKPNPDCGRYRQSEKLSRYQIIADELIARNQAYKVYDTREELAEQRLSQEKRGIFSFRYDENWLQISDEEKAQREAKKAYAIRLRLPKNKVYAWDDMVRGHIAVNSDEIGDWIIVKEDGFPTYNFAVVVDDYDMQISHVLRGEEHVTNTPKQLAVYELMNWTPPQFGHLTVIVDEQGHKLSKRSGVPEQFVSQFANNGYVPAALFNYLALLGWTHPAAREILTHEELVRDFDVARLSNAPSQFNVSKLRWFAKEYMKQLDDKDLMQKLVFPDERNEEWRRTFISTYKPSVACMKELQDELDRYADKSINADVQVTPVTTAFTLAMANAPFTKEGIANAINAAKEQTGAKGKDLFMAIRLLTTNQEHGPELATAIFLTGEELVRARIKQLIKS